MERLTPRLLCDAAAASLTTELVYDLNRVRYDPPAYASTAQRPEEWASLPPAQPLAINAQLRTAAEAHAAAMAAGDFVAHRNPLTGTYPNQRLRISGYKLPAELSDQGNAVELVAAGNELGHPDAVLSDLLNDLSEPERSRRKHLLGAGTALSDPSEIGVGLRAAADSSLGNYWAVEIARQHLGDRFLTGVVFADANGNHRFDAGEGLGGIAISSGPLTTTTDATGAYRLKASGGIHRLTASGDSLPQSVEQLVRLDSQNVQVDFLAGEDPQVNFRRRSLWTHPTRHLDTNHNGVVQPLDALLLINRLNREPAGELAELPEGRPDVFYDTSGDGRLSPLDVLLVVNHLNRQSAGGEGEISQPLPASRRGG